MIRFAKLGTLTQVLLITVCPLTITTMMSSQNGAQQQQQRQHRNRKRKCVTVCLLRSQLLRSGMCADQPYVINKSLDSHTHIHAYTCIHTHLQLDLYKCRIISTFLLFTFIWLERNAEIALKHLPGSSICVWQLDKYQDTRHTHTHSSREWVSVRSLPHSPPLCWLLLPFVPRWHFSTLWPHLVS